MRQNYQRRSFPIGEYAYSFPEKDIFWAMEATEPEFGIFAKGHENLYVPLQPLRNPRQFECIKRELGIFDQKN